MPCTAWRRKKRATTGPAGRRRACRRPCRARRRAAPALGERVRAGRDARREAVGQAVVEPGHLQPRAQREAERRDRRARRQPAARRRGRHHVAVPVDHVDVAGVADEELAVGPFGHRRQRGEGGLADAEARVGAAQRARPCGRGRAAAAAMRPATPGLSSSAMRAPVDLAQRARARRRRTSRRRCASTSAPGAGSPYQASRSASASFVASATRCTNAAPSGSHRCRGRHACSIASSAGTPGPGSRSRTWRPVAAEVERAAALRCDLPRRHVLVAQQAAHGARRCCRSPAASRQKRIDRLARRSRAARAPIAASISPTRSPPSRCASLDDAAVGRGERRQSRRASAAAARGRPPARRRADEVHSDIEERAHAEDRLAKPRRRPGSRRAHTRSPAPAHRPATSVPWSRSSVIHAPNAAGTRRRQQADAGHQVEARAGGMRPASRGAVRIPGR